MISSFINMHQQMYWWCMFALAVVCCVGWYYFGATRPDKIQLASAGQHSPALIIAWRFRPFAHQITFHLLNLVLVARLESSDTRLAAALEIQLK